MGKPQYRNGSPSGRGQGTKGERRGDYREKMSRRAHEKAGVPLYTDNVVPITAIRQKLVYMTEGQRQLGAAIRTNTAVFATGPAGTGKTHIAIAEMLPWFFSDPKNNRLILTNPATEIGEKLGFLPGDKDDKLAVSTRPLRDILNKLLGASHVDNLVEAGRILFEPLGSILGTTFDDSVIIFDEAQNSTPEQMKALLTRTGKRSKIIIAGDYKEQKFIEGFSGLEDAINRIGKLHDVGHVEFTPDDIVRSAFCKSVILAYRESLDS